MDAVAKTMPYRNQAVNRFKGAEHRCLLKVHLACARSGCDGFRSAMENLASSVRVPVVRCDGRRSDRRGRGRRLRVLISSLQRSSRDSHSCDVAVALHATHRGRDVGERSGFQVAPFGGLEEILTRTQKGGRLPGTMARVLITGPQVEVTRLI
jgi:hypothetical protein